MKLREIRVELWYSGWPMGSMGGVEKEIEGSLELRSIESVRTYDINGSDEIKRLFRMRKVEHIAGKR